MDGIRAIYKNMLYKVYASTGNINMPILKYHEGVRGSVLEYVSPLGVFNWRLRVPNYCSKDRAPKKAIHESVNRNRSNTF